MGGLVRMMNKKISGAFLYLQSLETVVVRSAAVLCDNRKNPGSVLAAAQTYLAELCEHSEEKQNLSVAGFFTMIRVHTAVMKIFD